MIFVRLIEDANLRELDCQSWRPLFNLILLCIPGVLLCQFVTIGLQLLRGEYGIFFDRRLYLYALCSATFLYFLWKSITFIQRFYIKKKIEKNEDFKNTKENPDKPQIPETKRRKDGQYWRQLFKPYISCLPGFVVGQAIFICLALIEKNFDFFKNHVQQGFLSILLLAILLYGILYYTSTKHQRSHRTNRESRYDLFKNVVNFIVASIPGAIVGILLQIINLESLAILHNVGQQIFVFCLFLLYLAFKTFQYRCWKSEEVDYEKIVEKFNSLSETVAFNKSFKFDLIRNTEMIENLYVLYQIVYSNNFEVEYISRCEVLGLEGFHRFLKIIECHKFFSFIPENYGAHLEIIRYNLEIQENNVLEVIGKKKGSEKIMNINNKSEIRDVLEIILATAHDQIILKPTSNLEMSTEMNSLEEIGRYSKASRLND